MPIITTQKLIDADKDADSMDAAVSGGDRDMVRTRRGKTYPTMPNAIRQIMENGGFRPFANEAELKAYRPTIVPCAAKDLSTAKVWLWDGTAWSDTGLSELDRANSYSKKNSLDEIKPYAIAGASELNELSSRVNILTNHQNYTDNHYIDESGNLIFNERVKTSDFIRTRLGSHYTISVAPTYAAAIYDANLNFIKVIYSPEEFEDYQFIIDENNAEFVRFTIIKDRDVTVTEVMQKYSLSWFKATTENIADAVQTIITGSSNENLLENKELIHGGYIDDKNKVQPYDSYSYSKDFIEIKPNTAYVISLASTYVGVYFDDQKNFIGSIVGGSSVGDFNYEFTTLANAKYIKVNISDSDKARSLKEKSYDIELDVKPKSGWKDKTIAWYGTSIPAGYPYSNSDAERDKYSHANLACHDLCARIINKCVPAGGVGLKVGLSFARTTDAINYQNSLLNLIGTADEPDLIVFDYGVNDYDQSPSNIDAFDVGDPFNEKMSIDSRDANTFIGAHNMIIDAMLTKKSDLKFCFITHFSSDNANPSISKKQDFFKQMNLVIQSLADYWSAPILNLHEKTGYRNRNNFNSIDPAMPDHIHPASGDGKSVESLRNIMRSFLISIA